MKININIDGSYTETEIIINCAAMSEELEKVITGLRALYFRLSGTRNEQTYILDASKILYIDTADKKTFLYTETEVCESNLRLYELEEMLFARDFFRAGKSSIINYAKIKSLKSDIDGRIIVVMENAVKTVMYLEAVFAELTGEGLR